jgi:hypothetical protein
VVPLTKTVKTFRKFGQNTKDAMIGVMATNIATNVVMSSSAGPLYNMVNTLQIILHFQGVNIQFPENIDFISNLFRQVTQCDLLPPEVCEIFYAWKYFNTTKTDQNVAKLDQEQVLEQELEPGVPGQRRLEEEDVMLILN